jgi:hypothetical protein
LTNATDLAYLLIEEGSKARVHFQVWWTLRNLALPKYYNAMTDNSYVDFFHAANSGHYTLFLLSLAKLFDRDSRAAGIRGLKHALRTEGKAATALAVASAIKPHEATVKSVMGIRNKSVVHNEHAISLQKVYKIHGVTPKQLRALIDAACSAVNLAARDLGIVNRVFEGNRAEQATLKMLETLAHGAKLAKK